MISIRSKLIICLSIILFSGFFATNFFSYTASKTSVRTSLVESSLPLSRDNIYSEIQRDLARPIFVSSLMAHDTFLKDWVMTGEKESRLIKKYLEEIKDKYSFSTAFYVSESSHNYYHIKGILKQISTQDPHDVWYYDFKKSGVDYTLDVDTNEAAFNHLTVFINHRLTGYEGKFLGVVGVGLDIKRVATLLNAYKTRYDRDIYMVDPAGLIQVHTDKSKIGIQNIHKMPGLSKLATKILDKNAPPSFFEYDIDNRHILLTSRYVKELDWFLMVEQNETKALAAIKTTFYKNIYFGILITLTTLIFATLVINYFQKRLEVMAMVDPLSRAYNRNEFERRFKYMTEMNRRTPHSMCMVLFDIDYFKKVNDLHGHLVGDHAIKEVARLASQTIRGQDLLVRWGGDEFILLIQDSIETSFQIADRLRASIASHDFNTDQTNSNPLKKLSISCGIAAYESGQSLDQLLLKADKALYQAKEKGKNLVIINTDQQAIMP